MAAVLPCIFGERLGWCDAILPCELLRACRCLGGIAELVSDIEGGGIAAAGAGAEGAGAAAGRAGPELYGVNPGPPGFGPGIPIAFPPEGLTGCAPTGPENASAATTATPVKRCFMLILLHNGC